jgi:cation diffusion facilitator family transporter
MPTQSPASATAGGVGVGAGALGPATVFESLQAEAARHTTSGTAKNAQFVFNCRPSTVQYGARGRFVGRRARGLWIERPGVASSVGALPVMQADGAVVGTKRTGRLRFLPPRRSAMALRRDEQGESPRTIVIALAANLVIGVAKLLAGLASGSSAMIAEAAHSAADCVNEVFLAIGLYRARQPADADHPFGHARERFLWAFMAAIASFLVGGCVSIGIAIRELEARSHPVAAGIAPWIILAVAFVADGASWLQALRQARKQAKDYDLTVWRYLVRSSDPVVRAVLVEDSAALIGLVLAAGGLLVSRIVGSNIPDSVASLAIGVLLAITAFFLARPFADFLVGRSIAAPQLERLRALVSGDAAIEELLVLQAMYSGPEEVVVLAKARPSPKLNIEELGRAMDELDRKIRKALPFVADVFIDVTGTAKAPEPVVLGD